MTRRVSSIEAAYFESLYQDDGDPWGFESSEYERRKYAATLAACEPRVGGRVLEVGCSIGVFTRLLSERSRSVLGVDVSDAALVAAKARCVDRANVTFENRRIPDGLPAVRFDLIILSEVLYYLDAVDLTAAATACIDRLSDGGMIVTCHWLGETNYPLTGAEASDRFASCVSSRLPERVFLNDATYRLERLAEAPPSASPK